MGYGHPPAPIAWDIKSLNFPLTEPLEPSDHPAPYGWLTQPE